MKSQGGDTIRSEKEPFRFFAHDIDCKYRIYLYFKFLVRLHGEYNILIKLCGNTT